MATMSLRPCGDFRTTYKQDTVIFDTRITAATSATVKNFTSPRGFSVVLGIGVSIPTLAGVWYRLLVLLDANTSAGWAGRES